MANTYDYPNLTLHGRFTHDGEAFTIYADLNGVEVPVQRLSVADYREAFTDAGNAAPSQSDTSAQSPAQAQPGTASQSQSAGDTSSQ